jgi:glycosyltransferase involved in cell wall biosynthesis
MKVLFIASGNSSQGISPIVRNQAESLQRAGVEVSLFPIYGRGIKGYFRNIFALKKHLSVNSYDIIHAHYGFSAIVSLFARKGEKLVVSFMGDDLIGSNKMNGKVKFTSKLVVALNKILSRHFYDYCIVKSNEMYNKLNIKHKALVPNGVDLQKFAIIDKYQAFTTLVLPQNTKLGLFVSDTSRPEKNFKLASEAVSLIKNIPITLITLSGVDNSLLVYYYNSADFLILTSYHEGSPNVIKEAMACNCPIVATDVGDIRWVIGDTEGCYITSFEPADVAEKIKMALEFSEKVGRTKGRERIIKLGLDSETIAKRIISVYKRVLQKKD